MSELPTRAALLDEMLHAEATRHHAALVERLTEGLPQDPLPAATELRAEADAKTWRDAAVPLYRAIRDQVDRNRHVKGEVTVAAEDVYAVTSALSNAATMHLDAERRAHKLERQLADARGQIAAVQVEADRLRGPIPAVPPPNDRRRALAEAIDRADAMCPRRLVGRLRWADNLAAAVLKVLNKDGAP